MGKPKHSREIYKKILSILTPEQKQEYIKKLKQLEKQITLEENIKTLRKHGKGDTRKQWK